LKIRGIGDRLQNVFAMKTVLILLLWIPSCSAPARKESQSPEGNSPLRATQRTEARLKPVAGDQAEPWLADAINERAKAANLRPLNSMNLNGDDLEFRVWVGFGKKPLEGFVIRRANDQWEGTFLESMNATTRPPYRRELSSPVMGWEFLWSELVDSGLLTLPDASQFQGGVDGTSYLVELKKDGFYRTYFYGNPNYQEWKEARQMLKIADLLYTRFGVER